MNDFCEVSQISFALIVFIAAPCVRKEKKNRKSFDRQRLQKQDEGGSLNCFSSNYCFRSIPFYLPDFVRHRPFMLSKKNKKRRQIEK